KDLEPHVGWQGESGRMFHVEWFNSRGEPGELEEFFLRVALPYWRRRGFSVKLFLTQHELGPREFWFVTQMEGFAALDRWPEMAAGEREGQAIMTRLLSLITVHRASIVKEV